MPFQFAKSSSVESNPEIYAQFIAEILRFNVEDPVFISDKSSLLNFESVNGDIDRFEKTREVFGGDVSDVEDGRLASIFTGIQSRASQDQA